MPRQHSSLRDPAAETERARKVQADKDLPGAAPTPAPVYG